VVGQDHPAELSHASEWRDNKWLVRFGYRLADGVICPSPTVRDDTVRWCRLPLASVALVPIPIPANSGVSARPPHRWLEPGQPPVFVSTANLTPWKRMELLIDAFADLQRAHDARLLILGDGVERPRIVDHIARRGLDHVVESLGKVDDPLDFAARAWAFVLASDEEGFSQVLVEAMSVGCPVITTDALGGGPNYVTDAGQYGVLMPRGDVSALAAGMRDLMDPESRARYAALGLQRVEAFSPLICATALVEFLDDLIGSCGRTTATVKGET
jgi:glycosyltransferase involved in cell wall biosynthesis